MLIKDLQTTYEIGEHPARDTLLSLERNFIPPLPDRASINPESVMYAQVGEIAVATGSIGTFVPNEEIIEAVQKGNVATSEEPQRIRGLGFQGGFRLRHEVNTRDPEYQERYTAATIAELAQQVATQRDWDGIDVLIIGSSTIIDEVPEMVSVQLAPTLSVGHVMHNHMACSSGGEGIIDGALMGEGSNLRVVSVGIDELSALTNFDPVTFATFSDGAAAIAFESREIEVLAGSTVVERDKNNILTIGPFSTLPDESTHTIDESRRSARFKVQDDDTAKYFRHSRTGTYLAIPGTGLDPLDMNAYRTHGFFVMGNTPRHAAEILYPYRWDISAFNGHQPSKEVVKGVNTMLIRHMLQLGGVPLAEAKKIVKSFQGMDEEERRSILQQYDLPYLQLPWDMVHTKFSNVSAATSLIQFCYAAQQGRMKPGDTIAEQFMGVGNTYGTYVLRLH